MYVKVLRENNAAAARQPGDAADHPGGVAVRPAVRVASGGARHRAQSVSSILCPVIDKAQEPCQSNTNVTLLT